MEYRHVDLSHEEFEREVDNWVKVLTDTGEEEGESDFDLVYNVWCGFLNDLVLMPQCADDPDESRIDQREYLAIERLFCKQTGMKRDSFLSKSFFMFYQGFWACENDRRRRAQEQEAASHWSK